MSQQTYPVKCECGVVHQCPAGYAGSRFACSCGKVVEVPALSALKLQAAELPGTPEAELEARARLGQLPVETECALCGEKTSGVVKLLVECERPTTRGSNVIVVILAIALFVVFGWIGLLFYRLLGPRWGGQQFGRYVAFDLPVRACLHCRGELLDPLRANEIVVTPTLYARVLAQYPNAVVVRCSVDPSRRMPNPFRRRRNRRILMALVGGWAGLAFFVSALFFGDHILSGLKASGEMTRDHRHLVFAGIGIAALGVAVLIGWGMAKLVGNVYRHFYPDMTKPSDASSVNSNLEGRP